MTAPTTLSPTLDSQWMPFTANKAFKARPRLLVSAKDMHYQSDDGREIGRASCRERVLRLV